MPIPMQVRQILEEWPAELKASALSLIDHYGAPQESSPSQLTWHGTNDGWKRTILWRDEVRHNFPGSHTDFLEQFIDYRVPIEMCSVLAEFDGSVIPRRTTGELSVRCGGIWMNFAAINLAHDIVNEERSVKNARDEYTRLYHEHIAGKRHPYLERFQFVLPRESTADPDSPVALSRAPCTPPGA